MQAIAQTGVVSGRQFTGPAQPLKSTADIAQNAHLSSGRPKKRERTEQNSDPPKRERLDRSTVDKENIWKVDTSSLVGRDGGLCNSAGVDRLLYLMQYDRNDGVRRPIDVVLGRTKLAHIIAATEQIDCLTRFLKLGGLPLLDEWLQEAHKGKPGNNESLRDGERASEDLLLVLLRALERLPVDLVSLKSCSMGKSVNNLRGHRNLEIQRRARKLVEMWKKRVDAEMKQSGDAVNQGIQGPSKQQFTDQSVSMQLQEMEASDVAAKVVVGSSKSASQKTSSNEFVAQGESSCTGTGKFASVASLCSPDIQSKALSGSHSEKACNNASQTTDLGSLWSNATLKSNNAGRDDANGKGKSSGSVHPKGNPAGPRSSMRAAGSKANLGKSALPGSRNVAMVSASDTGASTADHVDSACGRIVSSGQNCVQGTSGSSKIEAQTPSSGSSSPTRSDNHADSGDVTHLAASSSGRKTQARSCGIADRDRGSPSSKPLDFATESQGNRESERRDNGKSRESSPALGQKLGTASAPPFDRASGGMNLLACVAASECSMIDGKIHAALSDKRSLLGAAVISQESRQSFKFSPSQQGSKSHSLQPDAPPEARAISTEKEHFDRNSSTVSSPSAAETKSDTLTGDGTRVLRSDGPDSAALDTTSSDGESPVLSSLQPTSVSKEANRKQTLDEIATKRADSKDLCKLRAGKTGKDHSSKLALSAEAMGESSVSVVVEVGAALKESKVVKAERSSARTTINYPGKDSESPLRSYEDDALEVARQVAMEVEQEMVGYQRNSPERPTSKRNSSLSSGAIKEDNAMSVFEQSSKSFTRASGGERKGISDPETHSDSFRPYTVNWNLNHRVDEKAEFAYDKVSGQTTAETGPAVFENADARATDGEQGNLIGSSPPGTGGVVCKEKETPVCTIAPPQELKQVSCSTGAGGAMNSWEQTAVVSGSGKAATKPKEVLERPDFDLNEGLSCEEQDAASSLSFSLAKAPTVPSGAGPTAPIAVVAATKGPFIPPASPFRLPGEPGWKGSAATSAFRPAQPRRNAEKVMQTEVSKHYQEINHVKPLLNFDLNVAADKSLEDAGLSGAADMSLKSCLQNPRHLTSLSTEARSYPSESTSEVVVRPVWDLNCVDEGEEGGVLLVSETKTVDCLRSSAKKAKNTVLDFDLNDGPPPSSSEIRMGTVVANEGLPAQGRNSLSAVTLPAFASAGSSQPLPSTGRPFQYDVYRQSHGFPSSGIPYPPPPPAAYSYAGFPFGFNPMSFRTVSTPFLDPSEAHSYPALSGQILSTEAVFASQTRPPYLMGLADAMAPNCDGMWGRPNLDLNAGPEVGEVDSRDDRSRSRHLSVITGLDDQRRIMHQNIEISDTLKRKEPEGCWGMQRAAFKQPMWQ